MDFVPRGQDPPLQHEVSNLIRLIRRGYHLPFTPLASRDQIFVVAGLTAKGFAASGALVHTALAFISATPMRNASTQCAQPRSACCLGGVKPRAVYLPRGSMNFLLAWVTLAITMITATTPYTPKYQFIFSHKLTHLLTLALRWLDIPFATNRLATFL